MRGERRERLNRQNGPRRGGGFKSWWRLRVNRKRDPRDLETSYVLSAWGVDECEGRFLMFCHHLGWLSTLKLQKVSEGEVGVREVLVMVCHHLSAFQFKKKNKILFFLI